MILGAGKDWIFVGCLPHVLLKGQVGNPTLVVRVRDLVGRLQSKNPTLLPSVFIGGRMTRRTIIIEELRTMISKMQRGEYMWWEGEFNRSACRILERFEKTPPDALDFPAHSPHHPEKVFSEDDIKLCTMTSFPKRVKAAYKVLRGWAGTIEMVNMHKWKRRQYVRGK